MDDTQRPPIDPGPEPDTSNAAEPDDTESEFDAEDAPVMIDENREIVPESD